MIEGDKDDKVDDDDGILWMNACFMSFKMSGGSLEIPVNRLQQETSILIIECPNNIVEESASWNEPKRPVVEFVLLKNWRY